MLLCSRTVSLVSRGYPLWVKWLESSECPGFLELGQLLSEWGVRWGEAGVKAFLAFCLSKDHFHLKTSSHGL